MVTVDGVLTGVTVAHEHADVATIAEATPADPDAAAHALLAQDGVEEAFVLCTCNRAEFYAVTETAGEGRAVLEAWLAGVSPTAPLFLRHDEAIEHLARVASGLESQVLGEDEILGQLREAFHRGIEAGTIGPILEPTLLKAIHIGEQARAETTINEGVVSLASAAATCADERVDLATTTAVVVGAGEMGQRIAASLAGYGVNRLYVANRSVEAAEEATAGLDDATAIGLDDLPDALERAAICITATTSPEPIITPALLPPRSPLVVIDLGQPPDVASSIRERACVAYYDLDRLRVITDRTHERRADAAAEVERLIEAELDELHRRFKRNQAEAVIAAMRGGADRIKRRELDRARRRLRHGDTPPESVLEDLANALLNSLMAAPTDGLRDAAEEEDWSTINAAIRIFDPEIEPERLPQDLVDLREVATDD